MTEAEARARLERMVAASVEPTLVAADVDDLMALARLADSEDRPPSDPAWVPTYDLIPAAAEGWRRKAGKVAPAYSFSIDGQSSNRQQMFTHCLKMANDYANRVVSSVRLTSRLAE